MSYILTDLAVFSSAAGWLGPKYRVDHDISLLVPEIWARMSAEERSPKFLIEHGYLEKCADWQHDGQPVLASRLGYRTIIDAEAGSMQTAESLAFSAPGVETVNAPAF